jgi:uncharacterized protein YlzI (FlbEa/FlbD family)
MYETILSGSTGIYVSLQNSVDRIVNRIENLRKQITEKTQSIKET